jgi:DNA-binding response OmpR family regulator
MHKKILFVDNDTEFTTQVKNYMERFGFELIITDTQKEAEEIITKVKPDIAIVELMLESEDSGFVLSYIIKKRYPDVPVIISTAVSAETGISFSMESDIDKKWIKADIYLEKAITPEQLHKEILKLLRM